MDNRIEEKDIIEDNLYHINEENDNKIKEYCAINNWIDLLFTWKKNTFLKEFLKMSSKNENSKFIEAIQYEYGVYNHKLDIKKSFEIYKESADNSNDYLSMYRMFLIYFMDYKKFNVKRNRILEKFYLYKCFAYLPYKYIDNFSNTKILNKINIAYIIALGLDLEDPNLEIFNKLCDYLIEKNIFPEHQILLTKSIVSYVFCINEDEDKTVSLSILTYLNNSIEDNEITYKLACLEKDKNDSKKLFEKLYERKYYRAYDEYALLLINEFNEIEKSIVILKEGINNGNSDCYITYYDLLLYNIFLKGYEINEKIGNQLINLLEILIKNIISGNILTIYEFIILRMYIIKHFGLENEINKKYKQITQDLINSLIYLINEKNINFLNNNFNEDIIFELKTYVAILYYYGMNDILKKNIEKSYLILKEFCDIEKLKDSQKYVIRFYYKIVRNFSDKNLINKTSKELFNLYINYFKEEIHTSYYYFLGKYYENGIGVKKDDILAYIFYHEGSKITNKRILRNGIKAFLRKLKLKKKLESKKFINVKNSFHSLINDNKEENICCVCYDRKNDHFIIPCKHKFCEVCIKLITNKCPLCRGEIFFKLNRNNLNIFL